MTRVQVWIDGITPLLQDRLSGERPSGAPARDAAAARTIAERACYRTPDGLLYLPGAAIAVLLGEAADAYRVPGFCVSLGHVIPRAVAVLDDIVPLYGRDGRTRLTDFAVDARSERDADTGDGLMRYRPRLDGWSVCVHLGIQEVLVSHLQVREILVEGGHRIGLGAFRPAFGGSFGLFSVRTWEPFDAGREEVTR